LRISIVGTGYVGLVTGACLADAGHDVTCVDSDRLKLEAIGRGRSPIFEEGLESILRRWIGSRLNVTDDLPAAVLESDLTFIAVGTPFDGEQIDLSYVRQAARQVGRALRAKNAYHVVVMKSTVVPGTTDDIVTPALVESSGWSVGNQFGVGMNPEFLTEGSAVEDFMNPDRIVLGGIDGRTIGVMAEVYAPFQDAPVVRTTNKTAEMIKYASNAVLATMISFSNEIANLSSTLGGIDAVEVMKAVHLSRYFTMPTEGGKRSTAPITSFLHAGCGFGGSCLPKDVKALVSQGRSAGEPMTLLKGVLSVNETQPARMIGIIRRHFPRLKGLRVSVLGLAFKPDTDDTRESPAISIISELMSAGVSVTAYDPVVNGAAAKVLPAGPPITIAPNLEQAIEGADAVVIATSWREFECLPALLSGRSNAPLVVDGRRTLRMDGIERYDGIGL